MEWTNVRYELRGKRIVAIKDEGDKRGVEEGEASWWNRAGVIFAQAMLRVQDWLENSMLSKQGVGR